MTEKMLSRRHFLGTAAAAGAVAPAFAASTWALRLAL